jgi:hypothetical protein
VSQNTETLNRQHSNSHLARVNDLSTTSQADWSFSYLRRTETLWGPHGYHRYPAKFIPQLVRRIIEDYSSPGALIGDPFLGSSTTGVEALRAGRRFWGSDINPVALLISQAKCAPLNPQKLERTWGQLEDQVSQISGVDRRGLTRTEKNYIRDIDIAHASAEERLAYWFPKSYSTVLDNLLQEILDLRGESNRIFFLCAFSNILRRCSIWLSGSTKPQKDLDKILSDPIESFTRQARDMIRRNKLYWSDLIVSGIKPDSVNERYRINREDARRLSWRTGKLDLVVTSPPYATCYEYTEIHQLTQLWLDQYGILPDIKWQKLCIGSRTTSGHPTRETEGTKPTIPIVAEMALTQLEALSAGPAGHAAMREAKALRLYFHDMQAVFKELRRVVARNKRLVIVIGDSCKRGIEIPTTSTLCAMAAGAGFNLEEKIARQVPVRVLVITRDQKTGRFSSTADSDTQAYPEENILVFRRRP